MAGNSFVSWEDAVRWLKAQPDKLELVRACYFDDPLRDAAERYRSSSEWHEISRLLADSKKGPALDVGAGRGISSFALANEGWLVTALEPDGSAHVGAGAIRELAAETGLAITVVEKHGEELPFAGNSFDLVFVRQALHHAADLGKFCGEVFRVLRPGGHFLAVREHVITQKEDLPGFLNSHPLHNLYGGENAYMLVEYKRAITGSGMRLLRVLGPFATDINLFPETKDDLKRRIENRLGFRLPIQVFDKVVVPLLQMRNNVPGRLYSFFGAKP